MCSIALIIREMQIQTTMIHHLAAVILVRMAIIRKTRNNVYWWGCEEKTTLVHSWWEYKMVQVCKQYRGFSKNSKWSGNSTSDYLSGENKNTIWKDICTPMFVAALLTIAKIWKQPECLLTDESVLIIDCLNKNISNVALGFSQMEK